MKHDKKKQWLSIGLLTLGAAALASFAAAITSASVASFLPMRMFSKMLLSNSVTS